jgi:hypothetical protein
LWIRDVHRQLYFLATTSTVDSFQSKVLRTVLHSTTNSQDHPTNPPTPRPSSYDCCMDEAVFSGPLRQRGAGFGALAAGIGRVAIPLLRRYVAPVAKSVGRNLLQAAVPELASVIRGKKRGRAAIKSVLKSTALKQLGGAKRRRKARRPPKRRRRKTTVRKKKTSRRKPVKKSRTKKKKLSRHNFFSAIDASARR